MILINPISPVAIDLFGFEIRWYALAYIISFVLGLWFFKKLDSDKKHNSKYYDDLLTYIILGVILGGRLGYVLFYNLPFFIENPAEIFMLWHGGMSFHGGMLGVIAAVFLFARKQKVSTFSILDKIAVIAPIGLFFGRIANFINMEVMGRTTTMPWGIVFSNHPDALPRHPSPIYEASMEGILLFIIMILLWNKTKLKNRAAALSGIFGILYGIFRIFCEQFREPDIQLGFLLGTNWLTMGMILSSLMIVIGSLLIIKSNRK